MYRCDACDVTVPVKPAINVHVDYPNRMFPRGHKVCPGCKSKMDRAGMQNTPAEPVPADLLAQILQRSSSITFHTIRSEADQRRAAADAQWRRENDERAKNARTFSDKQALQRQLGTADAFTPLYQPIEHKTTGGLAALPPKKTGPKTGKPKRQPAIQLMQKPKTPRLVS